MLTVWENKEGDTRIRRQRLRKRAQFLRDAKPEATKRKIQHQLLFPSV